MPYALNTQARRFGQGEAGWFINDPQQAEDIIAKGQADLVLLAHKKLSDPHFSHHAAKALGVESPQNVLPPEYAHWLKGR